MVSTHVQFLEVSASHEPSLRPRPRSRTRPRPANLVSRTRTRTRTRTIGFMVPMRDSGIVEALHEPGGARLRRAPISIHWRSGLDGVPPHRSWSQCMRKNERRLPRKVSADKAVRAPLKQGSQAQARLAKQGGFCANSDLFRYH